MPIENYGVWVATPTEIDPETAEEDGQSPHAHVTFDDGERSRLRAAINLKSLSHESKLVFWLDTQFEHPIVDNIKGLARGWREVFSEKGAKKGETAQNVTLDLLRDNLVDLRAGLLVPHDVPGEDNDIIDSLVPWFQNAIDQKATMYIFGERFKSKDGIHDIHMNQGSEGRFDRYNGIHQDGGIIMHFAAGPGGEEHWEAFFIAFASQIAQTDRLGNGLPQAPSLIEYITRVKELVNPGSEEGPGPTGEAVPRPGPGPVVPPVVPPIREGEIPAVSIFQAVVNPLDRDNIDNPELIYLHNSSTETVDLAGWKIANGANTSQTLEGENAQTMAPAGGRAKLHVEKVPLSNKGGRIILKNKEDQVVDQVTYTAEQARQQGATLFFGRNLTFRF